MDTPPVPKPRSTFLPQNDVLKVPVPLPRTKPPTNNEKITASNVLRSISSVSKQITEDVAQKVSSSAKSANDKIEKSLSDSSRFAKDTFEKTLLTSRSVRNSVTKSVIQGTKSASIKLRMSKKLDNPGIDENQRSVSMPVVDVSLFDNIQFHSPLLEQKKYANGEDRLQNLPGLQLNAAHLDDLSLFSSNSDPNTDTVSNFSYDSRENDQAEFSLPLENVTTYDTPIPSRSNSVVSLRSAPEVPGRRKTIMSDTEVMRQNSLYENWTLPHSSPDIDVGVSPRPSKSVIYEFDPLNNNALPNDKKYEGVSNELILLESFLIGDTYGTIISSADNGSDDYEFTETEYFNPPAPPERFDSLYPNETTSISSPDNMAVSEKCENQEKASWYVSADSASVSSEQSKIQSTMMQKFSNILKFDTVKNRSSKQIVKKLEVIERPPINNLPVPYFSGMMNKVVSGVVEDLFKNSQSRFCVLSEQKLMCYSDPTNLVLKEAYMLENIHSVQIVLPLSSSTTNNSYCFEVTVSTGVRNTPRKVLFSCSSASERRNWAQKLAEHLTNVFPNKYTTEFTRCGWCYLKYNSDTLQFLRKQYDLENPERLDEAINILKDWLDKQTHILRKSYSKDYLERTIILSKGSVERAKIKLDKIATYRTLLPHFFEPVPDIVKQPILDKLIVGFSPKMTNDYYRVFWFKNIAKQSDYVSIDYMDFYRAFVMICEYLQANDYCNGILTVFDYRETDLFDLIKSLNVIEMHQALKIIMDGFGMRVKGIHFISSSKMIDMLIGLVKQALSAKIAERIQVHKSIDDLYKNIPKEIMPKDYGGQEKSLSELNYDLKATLGSEEFMKYFKEMQSACTNESYRRDDKFNDQCLGMPGSFRKLNVD